MKPPKRIYSNPHQGTFQGTWVHEKIRPDYLEYVLLPSWTSELPTEDGFYLIKKEKIFGEWLKIIEGKVCYFGKWTSGYYELETNSLQFSGPIPMPEEK